MNISIILPVYNDYRVEKCIRSIEACDYPLDRYEIIVVNNNSDAEFTSWLKDIIKASGHLKYVFESKQGSYAARNAGISVAKGIVLAFTDSDCVVNSDWLKRIAGILNDNEIDGVMGFSAGDNDNVIAEYEQAMYEQVVAAFAHEDKLQRIDTRNCAFKTQVYKTIGGFQSELQYGGDMEYGARAHEAGFHFIFSPSVQVTHHNPTHLASLVRKRITQNYGNMKIRELHNHSFVRTYFPHLFRFSPNVLSRVLWHFIKLEITVEFPHSDAICLALPRPLGFIYYKIVTIRAIQFGQLSYILGKKIA